MSFKGAGDHQSEVLLFPTISYNHAGEVIGLGSAIAPQAASPSPLDGSAPCHSGSANLWRPEHKEHSISVCHFLMCEMRFDHPELMVSHWLSSLKLS